ncbi:MAG: peptidoglycan-binding protein [Alphaproteobacteria bacterium]
MTRHFLAALLAAGALATAPAIAQQTSQSSQPTQTETVPVQLTTQQIMRVQQKLHEQNLYTGATDGLWGSSTQTAVKNFQRKEQLPVTGQLDTQTMARLGLGTGSGGSGTSGSGGSQGSQQQGSQR